MAISPDGRAIVFAASAQVGEALWLRSLNNATPRALPGTERARYPFWSPDNTSIGFFADGQLKRIEVETGVVQTLTRVPTPYGVRGTHDDTILFTPAPSAPVMRIPAAGGSPTAVIETSAESANQRFPRVLPDGRHFLYYATGTRPCIYVGQVDGPERRRLLEADAAVFVPPGHLLFVREGTLYAQAFDPERIELIGRPTTVERRIVSPSGLVSLRCQRPMTAASCIVPAGWKACVN